MVALPFPIPQASVPQHCPFQFRRPPSNGGPDSADPEQWGPRLRNTLGNWGEGGGGSRFCDKAWCGLDHLKTPAILGFVPSLLAHQFTKPSSLIASL